MGIGLRQPHYEPWLAQRPPLGFVEVHSENFFAEGGATLALLDTVRASHPVSLHGVGLSLGSACGLDGQHLAQLARLVDRVEPVRVSDHACFARMALPGQAPVHASDLLPLAFTPGSLAIMVSQVGQVQDRLKRPILVENLSASFQPEGDTLAEVDFLISLCQHSGCQLLLDLHNLMVSGLNRARAAAWPEGHLSRQAAEAQALKEALAFVRALPPNLAGELHLAGCGWPADPGEPVVDDHSQRVSPACWQLYEAALAHLGPTPTLIEWDTDLPPLETLLAEAAQATQRMNPVPA